MKLKETQELFDWLVEKGMPLYECANVLVEMETGCPLGLALLKVFNDRRDLLSHLESKLSDSMFENYKYE